MVGERKYVLAFQHTLRDKIGLGLYGSSDEALIIESSNRHPDLAVARRFLELDCHIQVAVGPKSTGRLGGDVKENVVSGRQYCRRGVMDSGADDDSRRGRVGPESDRGALGVVADVVHPLDVCGDVLFCSVQRPVTKEKESASFQ